MADPEIKIKRYADKENLKKLMRYSKATFATQSDINENFYTKEQIDTMLRETSGGTGGSTGGGTSGGDYYTKSEIDTKLNSKANTSDLSTVATSGSYNDLLDKPTSFNVDLSNYYTKSEVDNLLSNIGSGTEGGNAATATKLATARTIALSGAATGTATDFDGSGNITIPVTALSPSAIRAQWYAAYPDGPEAHNAMWGGRDITAAFDAGTVSEHIADGTFKDIFPGDYITKQVTIPRVLADDGTTVLYGGDTYTVNWVIADCDYWGNTGGHVERTHHVAIVPDKHIFFARMNATNTTEGGYAGSDMYKKIIPACATGIVNAFGSDHILEFRDAITNSVDTSHASSGLPQVMGTPSWFGEWVSVQCNLMSEKMVYGAPIFSAGAMNNVMAIRQMSAFRLSTSLINNDIWERAWWLRDVVSSSQFAAVYGFPAVSVYADAYRASATDVAVRPFALLR